MDSDIQTLSSNMKEDTNKGEADLDEQPGQQRETEMIVCEDNTQVDSPKEENANQFDGPSTNNIETAMTEKVIDDLFDDDDETNMDMDHERVNSDDLYVVPMNRIQTPMTPKDDVEGNSAIIQLRFKQNNKYCILLREQFRYICIVLSTHSVFYVFALFLIYESFNHYVAFCCHRAVHSAYRCH